MSSDVASVTPAPRHLLSDRSSCFGALKKQMGTRLVGVRVPTRSGEGTHTPVVRAAQHSHAMISFSHTPFPDPAKRLRGAEEASLYGNHV